MDKKCTHTNTWGIQSTVTNIYICIEIDNKTIKNIHLPIQENAQHSWNQDYLKVKKYAHIQICVIQRTVNISDYKYTHKNIYTNKTKTKWKTK